MNKQELYEHLKNCGVDFEITEHPAVWNMEDVAQLEMPHPEADAKNLFVREDKTKNYFLIT
ncbi:MAG: prolyl-tRNA synthetase associated domain-containing protein, partial [Firmicutes bacterium]|nr:prolyl-tRNA synthetase associated domain-containing protein [Bacillota bacterium]